MSNDDLRCFVCNAKKKDCSRFYKSSKYSDGKPVCNKHYMQLRDKGEIADKSSSRFRDDRVCDVCGSRKNVSVHCFDDEYQGKMLCGRHRNQVRTYGYVLNRTRSDRNEIIIKEDCAEVILYNLHHEEIARAIIDIEEVETVREYKWFFGNHGYCATSNIGNTPYLLHQLIMNTKDTNYLVDHIDRNRLNNRKSNLRIADYFTNAINIGLQSNNKSGVTGVSFNKKSGKWVSYIGYKNKTIILGKFSNKDDAIRERLNAEFKFHRDFSPQKHLFEQYGIGCD